MRKLFGVTLIIMLFATMAIAENDVPISMKRLPEPAQAFVREYFPRIDVAYVQMDSGVVRHFEVKFVDDSKVDFNGKGEWMDVETPNGVVPSALIPKQIVQYIDKNYPGRQIKGVEREGKAGCEIWLDNGLGIEFDRHFRVVDIDR